MEARLAALGARRLALAEMIEVVRRIEDRYMGDHMQALVDFAQSYPDRRPRLEPWLLVELDAKASF